MLSTFIYPSTLLFFHSSVYCLHPPPVSLSVSFTPSPLGSDLCWQASLPNCSCCGHFCTLHWQWSNLNTRPAVTTASGFIMSTQLKPQSHAIIHRSTRSFHWPPITPWWVRMNLRWAINENRCILDLNINSHLIIIYNSNDPENNSHLLKWWILVETLKDL